MKILSSLIVFAGYPLEFQTNQTDQLKKYIYFPLKDTSPIELKLIV